MIDSAAEIPEQSLPLHAAYVLRRYPVVSETFIALEVEELRTRGVHVTIVAGAPDTCAGPGVQYLRGGASSSRAGYLAAHVRWVARHPRRYLRARAIVGAAGPERGEGDWRRLPHMASSLRGLHVDVLHAHFGWSASVQAWAMSVLLDVPWALTVHARDIYVDPVRLREKLEAASAVITVCDYNAEYLRTEVGFLGTVHKVICGVRLPPEPTRVATEPPRVVAVGRLVEKKGFDLLVRASADLSGDVEVAIYGTGPELDRLTGLSRAVGARVDFVGEVPHAQVLAAIDAAAVLVLPARIAADGDRDSMPVVVKEAMARSIPVVVTDVAGLGEMVDDTVGWIVPSDDVEALGMALRDSLADPVAAGRRGLAGRERVRQRYRLEDQVDRLELVLREVAGR